MKKNIIVIVSIFLGGLTYGQIGFEKGYFVNNSDQQVECLIRNLDWKDNPKKFEYRLTEQGDSKEALINDVKEFSIYGESKYVRQTVDIDKSSNMVKDLKYEGSPEFVSEQLFLKVILEGDATLYSYNEGNIKIYFYNLMGSKVEQLIYKMYITDDVKIRKNTGYKQQLWNSLKCNKIDMDYVESLNYSARDFLKLFKLYNECQNSEFVDFKTKDNKDFFNLNIRPGVNLSNIDVNYKKLAEDGVDFSTKFDSKIGFIIGVEAEFILPFNKNKWAIIVEPTYHNFKSDKEITYIESFGVSSKTVVNADYSSIELPVGVRYYSYINDDTKLFFNASLVFDFPFSSSIYAENRDLFDLEVDSSNNLALGLGVKYDNKFSFEFRYGTGREITGVDTAFTSTYKSFSAIFGYTLF